MSDYDTIRALVDGAEAVGDPAGEYRPSYNGWMNRETWNASLWINNEQGTHETARRIVREAMDGSDYDTRNVYTVEQDRRYQLTVAGDALKDWWDEANAPEGASALSDAWSYAVAATDWTAVAEGLAEDMPAAGSGYLP